MGDAPSWMMHLPIPLILFLSSRSLFSPVSRIRSALIGGINLDNLGVACSRNDGVLDIGTMCACVFTIAAESDELKCGETRRCDQPSLLEM